MELGSKLHSPMEIPGGDDGASLVPRFRTGAGLGCMPAAGEAPPRDYN
jgi:hypothetical protein